MLMASEILILALFGTASLTCFILGAAPLFTGIVRRFVERWG